MLAGWVAEAEGRACPEGGIAELVVALASALPAVVPLVLELVVSAAWDAAVGASDHVTAAAPAAGLGEVLELTAMALA
jgi:hypothetical protein